MAGELVYALWQDVDPDARLAAGAGLRSAVDVFGI